MGIVIHTNDLIGKVAFCIDIVYRLRLDFLQSIRIKKTVISIVIDALGIPYLDINGTRIGIWKMNFQFLVGGDLLLQSRDEFIKSSGALGC